MWVLLTLLVVLIDEKGCKGDVDGGEFVLFFAR
jgi:hypothetical protein